MRVIVTGHRGHIGAIIVPFPRLASSVVGKR